MWPSLRNPSIGELLKKKRFQESELLEMVPKLRKGDAEHLSKQSWATQKVLVAAVEVVDESDLYYLIRNPNFPTRELARYADLVFTLRGDRDVYISRERDKDIERNMSAIFSHPNCSPETLSKFFSGSGFWLSKPQDIQILLNPNISDEIFEKVLASDDLDLLLALCRNKSLSDSRLKVLGDLPYSLLHEELRKHPRVSDELLRQINQHSLGEGSSHVEKLIIAEDVNTSPEILHALSRDVNPAVRLAVAGNSKLSSGTVESLIESTNLNKYFIDEEALEILLTLSEIQILSKYSAWAMWKKFYESGVDGNFYGHNLRHSALFERAKLAYWKVCSLNDEDEDFDE